VLRLERELPPGVRRLVVRTRRRLSALEAQAARAQAKYQRQAAKLLRQARSDRAWKKLDAQARRRVRQLLQRLEKAIG
jgi:hypothetical protein